MKNVRFLVIGILAVVLLTVVATAAADMIINQPGIKPWMDTLGVSG